MAVWYCLWSFGIFSPIWNVWTKKNLATLLQTQASIFPQKNNQQKTAIPERSALRPLQALSE
jgi:hypothetical protein